MGKNTYNSWHDIYGSN